MTDRASRDERCDVVLVAMPWAPLHLPSIQLGLLSAIVRERTSLAVTTRSFYLDFFAFAAAPSLHEPLTARAYDEIAERYARDGAAEWVFAIPPLFGVVDAAFESHLRARGVGDAVIARLAALRARVPAFIRRCADDVLRAQPRVVGFTTMFSQTVPSLVLAGELKRRQPDLVVVFGGANCEGPMGAALLRGYPVIDLVVRGEADAVVAPLFEELVRGGPVRPHPGLCYRAGAAAVIVPEAPPDVDLDASPVPNYDEYFERVGRTAIPRHVLRLPIETSRGCWWGAKHHCTFCGLNGSSMAFRAKSGGVALREIRTLSERYAVSAFDAVDNILDMRYFDTLLPALGRMREAGCDVSLFYEIKANLKKEQVLRLRQAGITMLQPGIESLSTPLLHAMDKGVTALQNARLLKWCAEYGIQLVWNIITGFPTETADDYARMLDVVPRLSHLPPPSVVRLHVDRFSPYADEPERFGIALRGPKRYLALLHALDPALVADLAYTFEYDVTGAVIAESVRDELVQAVDAWRTGFFARPPALTYRMGPGFVTIVDQRRGFGGTTVLRDVAAAVYLACDAGATPHDVTRSVERFAGGVGNVRAESARLMLEEFESKGLMLREGDRYLALAVARVPVIEPLAAWMQATLAFVPA